jgi:hypothetical protein
MLFYIGRNRENFVNKVCAQIVLSGPGFSSSGGSPKSQRRDPESIPECVKMIDMGVCWGDAHYRVNFNYGQP